MVARSAEDYELYVKLILSSFKEYDGYVHVSIKEIEKFGLSHSLYITHLRNLISRGEIEDFSVNGFFNRYKLHFKLDTPSFMIDANLTFYEKVFLYKLRILIPTDIDKVTNRYLQTIFINNSKSHISHIVYNCKHKLQLNNLLDYARNASILQIDLFNIYTSLALFDNGFQLGSESNGIGNFEIKDLFKYLYKKSYKNFKKRNNITTYSLTPEIIETQYKKQNGLDYYTGLPFEDKLDISIDRLDSNKGYESDNIVLTRIIINQIKNDQSIDEFLKLITQIHSHISR